LSNSIPTTSFQITTIIVPQKLIENNKKEDVLRLVKALWNEHLIENKLQSNSHPTLQRYYSQQLMKERYQRAQLEIKLYGDAIAKDGLRLIASSEFSHRYPSGIL
jgi:hypothetical protein